MTGAFSKLRNFVLYGSRFKLRPYEKVVLGAWQSRLSGEGKSLLAAQLELLPSYQRQAREMLCFFPLGSKPHPSLPDNVLFPCRLQSCVVALVHLAGFDQKGRKHRVRAEIHLHEGQISLIEFNQPPSKRLVNGVEIAKIEILRDPMLPASEETISGTDRREEVLRAIQAKLPSEYLQLLADSKGVSVNGWTVSSVQDIWKTPKRDGSYYLLAEKEGMGAVGVKEDEFTGQVYYLDYDDARGEKISVGFTAFLQQFDGGKVEGRF